MVHNQHFTASDLLLQRQIASDDKRKEMKVGFMTPEPMAKDGECLNLPLEKKNGVHICAPDDNRWK